MAPSRTQIGDLTGLRLDAAALKVLAHPLRSRLLSALRVDGPATATDLATRLETNSGATSYHLRKLESVGLVVRHRRGRGQAPAVAGRHRLPHLGGQRLRRRRGLRDRARLAGPRLRPPLRRAVRALARRAGHLAPRVARRRRHERQLHRRHPRAGRAAQGRGRRARSSTAASGRATRGPPAGRLLRHLPARPRPGPDRQGRSHDHAPSPPPPPGGSS